MPFTTQLIVEAYLSGRRVDTFLTRHFRNYTADRMLRLVRAGQVRIEGLVAACEQRVYRGQRVAVRLIEPPDKLLEAVPGALDILYEDPWLLIVDKPAGQIVHPVGEFQDVTLANHLQAHLDAQTSHRGILRPGIVHRLDRFTSGVLVVTKHHLAHRDISIQFQQRLPKKTYIALVEGVLPADAGTIDFPVGRQRHRNVVLMSAAPDALQPRVARTDYTVLDRFDKHTLVEARPQTGRLHQIRVHFAQLGFPVADDEFYTRFGAIKDSAEAPESSRSGPCLHAPLLGRQVLHAAAIELTHPVTRMKLCATAPLPPDFRRLIDALRTTQPATSPASYSALPTNATS